LENKTRDLKGQLRENRELGIKMARRVIPCHWPLPRVDKDKSDATVHTAMLHLLVSLQIVLTDAPLQVEE